jgi:hypothetical protein
MIMIAEKQRVVGWTRSEVELLVDAVSDASNYVLTELLRGQVDDGVGGRQADGHRAGARERQRATSIVT